MPLDSSDPLDDVARFWALARELFCVLSQGGEFIRVNPAWTRVLGWREDELLGRRAFEFVHPDDLASTRHVSVAEGAEGQELEEFQNRYRHKDGSVRWLSWSGYKHGDQWFGMARDITASRTWHDAMQRSERRSRAVLEALGEGLVIIDTSGQVIEVNQRFADMVGSSAGELIGARPPSPGWPPEQRSEIRQALEHSVPGERRTRELTFQRSDGRRFPVIIDEADLEVRGGQTAVLSVVRDVSELVGTRDRLAEAHRVADLNSWEWYPDRDCVTVFEDPLSSAPQATRELTSEGSLAAVAEPFRTELRRLRDETVAGLRTSFALDVVTAEPAPGRWIEIRGEQICDPSGTAIGVRGTAQDITARRHAEFETRLQSDIIDAIDVAVIIRGPGDHVVHANAAAERMFGRTRDELAQIPPQDERLLVPGQAAATELAAALETTGSWEGELDVRHADGSVFRVHTRLKMVADETGRTVYRAAILTTVPS